MKSRLSLYFFTLPFLACFNFSALAQDAELIYACENCGFEYLLPLENGNKVALFKRDITNATLTLLDKQNLVRDSLIGYVEVAGIYKLSSNSFGTHAGYIGGEFTIHDSKIFPERILKVSGNLQKQKQLDGYGDYFNFGEYYIVRNLSPRKGKGRKNRGSKVGYFHWDDLPKIWEHDVFTELPIFYGGRIPPNGFVNLQYHNNPMAIWMHNNKIQWVSDYKPWSTIFNARNRITVNPNTQTAYFLNGHQNGEITFFTRLEGGGIESGFLQHDIDTKKVEFLDILCDFYSGTLYAIIKNPEEKNRRELWAINVKSGKSTPTVILRDFTPYHIEGRRMYYIQKKNGITGAYAVTF